MERSQITGEELLKGGQYFKKIFKKEGGISFKNWLGLNDQDGTGFQLIHDGHPMSSEVRPLN